MTLNTYVFIPISWRMLLEESHKFLQFLLLILTEVAVYKDYAPIGKTANTFAILPKTNVESHGFNVYTYTTTVLCRCNVKAVSVTEPLANIEVEIQ
ncbi:hypothetical protein IR149_08765 [Bacteroides acidifaciens]|nr:hypothetical protein [Bacteroides acidifaciens]